MVRLSRIAPELPVSNLKDFIELQAAGDENLNTTRVNELVAF
jgi:hypothetical protein